MTLHVRLAELPRDEDGLVALQDVAFRYWGGVAAFKRLIRERDLSTFVLDDGRRLIAAMSVREGDPLCYMGIMTHPDYRRHGYARFMIREVMRRRHAGRPIELYVASDNDAARRLYLSLGFELVGEEHEGDLAMRHPGRDSHPQSEQKKPPLR